MSMIEGSEPFNGYYIGTWCTFSLNGWYIILPDRVLRMRIHCRHAHTGSLQTFKILYIPLCLRVRKTLLGIIFLETVHTQVKCKM